MKRVFLGRGLSLLIDQSGNDNDMRYINDIKGRTMTLSSSSSNISLTQIGSPKTED